MIDRDKRFVKTNDNVLAVSTPTSSDPISPGPKVTAGRQYLPAACLLYRAPPELRENIFYFVRGGISGIIPRFWCGCSGKKQQCLI